MTHARQGVAIAALSALLVLALALGQPSGPALAPYRSAMAVLAAIAMALWARDSRRWLLLAPVTILGLLALFAFSGAGALFATFSDFESNELRRMTGLAFNGSAADRLLLLFTGGVLFSSALWSLVSAPHCALSPILSTRQRLALAVAVLSIAALNGLWAKLTALEVIAPAATGGLMRQAVDALAPLFAIGGALLFIDAMADPVRRRLPVAVAALAAATVFQVAGGVGKPPIFLGAGLSLIWLVLAPSSRRIKAVVAVVMVGLGLAALTAVSYVRGIEAYSLYGRGPGAAPVLESLAHTAMLKVVERQTHTGYCLENVIKQHWDAPPANGPWYFLSAPVPRILWPGKPSLSPGERYSVDYCGLPTMSSSSSVTLLGQPVIEAGPGGLAAAVGVLILALPLLARYCLNRGTLGAAVLIGLYPWLIDFDQHYAMYWANGLKMFLYMAPVWGWLIFSRRKAALDLEEVRP